LLQGPEHAGVIQVHERALAGRRVLKRRAESVGLVGLSDERSQPVLVGIEGDAHQVYSFFDAQLPDGTQAATGGFPAVDDGDST
jgi:hypothetical protein